MNVHRANYIKNKNSEILRMEFLECLPAKSQGESVYLNLDNTSIFKNIEEIV